MYGFMTFLYTNRSIFSFGKRKVEPKKQSPKSKVELHCARCGGRLETVPHLLWTCSFTTTFVQRLSASLYHRFPGQRFGKHFWIFGQIPRALSDNAYFLQWTRFWALWTIWTARNYKVFDRKQLHEVSFFKQSLRQSLFDCLQLRDITLQIYNLYFECF